MITLPEIKRTLENNDPAFIEGLAQKAHATTLQFFGRTISLYAPIYLSNYCSSYCTYCGFHNHNKIKRIKLTAEQIDQEMAAIADMISEVLMDIKNLDAAHQVRQRVRELTARFPLPY